MVPGTILTVGPSLGDLLMPLGAFGPRKNKDQPGPSIYTERRNEDPSECLSSLSSELQMSKQHTRSVPPPCHPLALGLKSNRIFAGRVGCSGKGKVRTGFPGYSGKTSNHKWGLGSNNH